MAKARLLEAQSPAVQTSHPSTRRLTSGPSASDDSDFRRLNPSGRWATGNEPVQGDGPGRLRHARYVQRKRNSGWPTGREPYGYGVSVVVAGVTTCHGDGNAVYRAKGHRCLQVNNDGEVREMRDAATVLEIIRERGRRGLPLERVYRCLFNPDLYLVAYGKLYRNAGAMTPGATSETVDGTHLGKIEAIITTLRQERYRWTPVRRTYIEKKGTTKKRPLGLPTWSDKLLQEVLRLLLEAYYEPQFSEHSHGCRLPRAWDHLSTRLP
jgi:hypothetical protein